MSIDLQKYCYDFLTSPSIDYEMEINKVFAEKHKQQELCNSVKANELWRIEKRISIFMKYAEMFRYLNDGFYYKAWCVAEDIEISIKNLILNFPEDKPIIIPLLTRIIKLQQLFPYRAFASTEIVVKEYTCSICGTKSTPRNRCNHQVRRVYNGEMCCHIVSKFDLLGISIVTNPEHKYAVLFPSSKNGGQSDNYDYSAIKGLLSVWHNPFQFWDYSVSISYIPKTQNYNPDSLCPCYSGKEYKDCCMDKPGIRHIHITILLEENNT